MDQISFQMEVIDRLGRIETKQDMTNGRVTKLEQKTRSLELTRASHSGASHLLIGAITAGGAVLGAAVTGFIDYVIRK